MSRKTLNADNLARLGVDRLAGLVMDLVAGSAALQRRARLELSAAQGPDAVEADLRVRLARLRRATGRLDRRRQGVLLRDLTAMLAMIQAEIAPWHADRAFDLLWAVLDLAPGIEARTADDGLGAVGAVMGQALDQIAGLAPRLSIPAPALADRILDAAEGGGLDPALIAALSPGLGDAGLEHLKRVAGDWAEMGAATGAGAGAFAGAGPRLRAATGSRILARIADLQGDVDAYMARYSAEQLTFGTVAPEVARRLLDADRVPEALDLVQRARAADANRPLRLFRRDLDLLLAECLDRLGRTEALMAHLWDCFARDLDAQSLRDHLKRLPDFDDLDAEDRALDLARTHPDAGAALRFLIAWPRLDLAAQLVVSRPDALDHADADLVATASAALEGRYPLAATLLRRAMIRDVLASNRTRQFAQAARHLAACAAAEAAIEDHRGHPTHAAFQVDLRRTHARRTRFWARVVG